jgi:hypothetical protein
MATTLDTTPEFGFDPFSRELQEDPYPVYRVLRDHHPVYYSGPHRFFAISRFDDVQRISRDWRTFSSADGVEFDGAPGEYGVHEGSFIDSDPPRHNEMRKLLQSHFSPAATAKLDDTARGIAESLFTRLLDTNGGDLAQCFAIPFPVRLASSLLGLPEEDADQLTTLALDLATRQYGTSALSDVALSAGTEIRRYFASLMRDPDRIRPGGVLRLIAPGGERSASLSADERVGMAVLLFIASTETTAGFLSSIFLLLDRYPRQRNALVANRDLIPAAIEELLRYDPPVQYLARTASAEVSLHGVTIPQGSRVLMLHGAACRDDRKYPSPDTLDVTRNPERSTVFGEGIHFCLGAPLARLEARVALEIMLREAPGYRVTGSVERVPSNGARPIRHLPVSLCLV